MHARAPRDMRTHRGGDDARAGRTKQIHPLEYVEAGTGSGTRSE
eukprot:COSAG02_NODE_18542_length_933_cov_1.346523_3_plen_43_part_01